MSRDDAVRAGEDGEQQAALMLAGIREQLIARPLS